MTTSHLTYLAQTKDLAEARAITAQHRLQEAILQHPYSGRPDEPLHVVYRVALHAGLRPTQAVAAYFGVTIHVAAKMVQKARRAGHLKPTRPGAQGG